MQWGDVQRVVHAAQVLDEQLDLFVIVCAAQLHLVCDDAVALFGLGVLGVEGDDLRQVHGVGRAVDDVCAVVCKGSAGLVGHGVHDAQQCVGESHTGKALGVVHGVALGHIAIVAVHQIALDHADGEDGQRVGVVAVRGGNISLHSVSHGVHTGVGNQLFGHGLSQIGVNDGHVRGDLEVRDGVLDALLVVGNDGESGHLGGSARGGGNSTEVCLAAQRRDAEHLAHLLKGDLGVLVLDPHGLGCIDGRAAAHGDDPVGLKLQHGLGTAHDGLHGRIGFDALEQLHFHAGFLQVLHSTVQEAEALHGAAADTDHCLFSGEGFQRFQSALAMVQITGQSKTSHNTKPPKIVRHTQHCAIFHYYVNYITIWRQLQLTYREKKVVLFWAVSTSSRMQQSSCPEKSAKKPPKS